MRELEQLGIMRREAALGMSKRVWAHLVQAFREAVPAEEPHCIHGCGPGYCEVEGCEYE